MKPENDPGRDPQTVRNSLEKVLSSRFFGRANRQRAFLRHIVENFIDGNSEALREYQIGLKVYERGNSYDTRSDPIVRVEAARLRSKLREYYESEGAGDIVRFELPKGSYSPILHWREDQPSPDPAPPPLPEIARHEQAGSPPSVGLRWRLLLLALGLAAVAGAGYWLQRARSENSFAGMPRSIAILPFRNLSGASINAELCDALAESLTEELSRVEGLQVAGRTSTLRVSDRSTDLQELGRQLHVGAILEGSVQSASQQIRVRARMFDVNTGFQLWSGTFDRTSSEVFAVQDEIARAITATLRLELGRRRQDPAVLKSPARREAHELFTKGRQLHRRGDGRLLLEARAYHLRAVQADPSYPLAHSGLAHINITIMSEGLLPVSQLRLETVQGIEKALELDPGLSDAYSARIRMARDIDLDWRTVEGTCSDVTRLFPNAASIRGNCGTAYAILGRFPQAEEELRASVRLDPLWPGGQDGLAWMLYLAGRPDEAIHQVQELLRIEPEFKGSRRTYARILIGSGRLNEARQYLEKEIASSPDTAELWSLLGYVRGRLNDKAGARACLARLGRRPLSIDQAMIWLGLGEIDRAAGLLDAALDQRESAALDVIVDSGLNLGPHGRRLRAKVRL